MEKIFIVSPVRNINAETHAAICSHIARPEREGHTVYWPARDTNQDDPVGLRICQDNREAIYQSESVHVWVDRRSQGSVFDLGMLYYFLHGTHKKFRVINERALGWHDRHPMTMEDVLLELDISPNMHWMEHIRISSAVYIEVNTNVPDCLFFMGMAFASLRNCSKKIFISNRDQISRTPYKSFENVFLELAQAS